MSSPLQSLRKDRKTPLSPSPSKSFGKRPMPFRNSEYTATEKNLLDEITTNMAANSKKKEDLPDVTPRHILEPLLASPRQIKTGLLKPQSNHQKSSGKADNPPSDMDLMASMMQRITLLEKRNLGYTKEIIEKDKRIKVLEEKLFLYQKANKGTSHDVNRVNDLERNCLELKQQIYEMETFLADYGMVWVGDGSTRKSTYIEEVNTHNQPQNDGWDNVLSDKHMEFQPDYNLIIKNIKELNVIAGEGTSQVKKTSSGAVLRESESVRMVLYKNGIVMFNGPFRSFDDVETRRCMTDLMDGYFPSELEGKFPDGVPINVTDNRSITFEDPKKLFEEFPGVGQLLGGEKQPSSLLSKSHLQSSISQTNKSSQKPNSVYNSFYNSPSPSDNSQTSQEQEMVTSELPVPKLSTEQFLNRLPKSVIKNGTVVDVRSSISSQLGADVINNSTQVLETDVLEEFQKRMNIPERDRPPSARNITTLRVKSEDGKKTYLIKMKFESTIQDVKKYIDKQRPHHRIPYDLISNFPTKVHSNVSETLLSCGLTPNANLCLRPRKLKNAFK